MDRAYALLDIKSIAPAMRTFRGIASTPELDRNGDSLDPAGATFRESLPLLWHHDQKQPVGRVTLTRTPEGILFEATIPEVDEPGPLKTRVDEAWQSIKAGVITGVSIGHRVLAGGLELLRDGTKRITKSEICELSLVTIPANASASILTVKSLSKGPTMTIADRIHGLTNTRTDLGLRMRDLMESAPADGTLDEATAATVDGLKLQIKNCDADLTRWRDMEALQMTTATPVARTPASPYAHVSVTSNLPAGTAFIRYHCARIAAKMEGVDPAAWAAARWNDSTPGVALALKAAVAPGTATDALWAAPLVNANISKDFIAMMRAATIIDQVSGLRKVPFNTKIPMQLTGGTYSWVGEMKPKPVTSLTFGSASLDWAKCAGIIVLTQELIKLSNPDAEDVVRQEMVAGITAFLDGQFINPAVAAVAGISPASITNGAPTAAATANPLADILGLIQHFVNNNISVAGLTFLMSPTNALALSFKTNTDGSQVFPGITAEGGTFKGMKFIASQTVGNLVIAMQPRLVMFADDGAVTIDASTEASLQMDSAPDSPVAATTVYVSMFQMNTVALRAERFITWKKANANAVKYLTAAAYPAPALAMDENGNGAEATAKSKK
ncbi:MAG TPA: phage major capsid protein [Xanthobacteraceae bacterium]|nr:phage major capsid protein [Xanthobacteraceae bacterium]